MPSTLPRRHRIPAHTRTLAVLAVVAGVGLGLTACSDDDKSPGTQTPAAAAPSGTPTPSATGAVSDKAAWAAHRPVPAGFTRLASAKLSIGVPDGYEAINDPQRLGTTDLAARDGKGSVIAARVIPIGEEETVPEEGPAWAIAGDVAKQAEAAGGKNIEIVDADVEGQDGWRVIWVSPKTADLPELKHIWSLVDLDEKSIAGVTIQAVPAAFKDGALDQVADTLVIRGVTDGTAPSPTTKS